MRILVFLLILLMPPMALGQEANPTQQTPVRFEETFNRLRPIITLRLEKMPRESGWRVRLLEGAALREVASAGFPEWAGAEFYDYSSQLVTNAGVSVILFQAQPSQARNAPNAASHFQAAFAKRGRSWTLIAQTRYSLLDGGTRLEWTSVDGTSVLVKRAADSGTFCGDARYGGGFQRFLPTSLTFSSAVDSDELEASKNMETEAELPATPFETEPFNYALWYAASSNLRNPDDSVTTIRPSEVGDLDGRTAWVSGRPGDNRGQFLTARLNQALKLKGMRLFPGHGASQAEFDAHPRPKKLLISTENQRVIVDLPDAPYEELVRLGGLFIRLPEPVRARCMSVVVLETYPATDRSDPTKSRSVAITEITPVTELHGIPPDVAALIVVEMLLKQSDPTNARRLAQLTAPIGTELSHVLNQVIETGTSSDAAHVAPLLRYLPAEESVPILFDLFRNLNPEDPAYVQVKRSMVANGDVARNFLTSIPIDELDHRKHVDLVRMIGRVGTKHDLELFVAELGEGDDQLRRERVRAVVRGGDDVLPALFRKLASSPSTDAQDDAMKAIFSISRKLFYTEPGHIPGSEVVADVVNTADKRNRLLAIETLGYLAAPNSVGTLTSILESASSPTERRFAARALGRYSQRETRITLENALLDPSPDVRIESIIALSKREDLNLSQAAILEYANRETWPQGLQAAYNALAKLGTGSALTFLQTQLLREPESKSATQIADSLRRADRSISAGVATQLLHREDVPFLTKRHLIDSLGAKPDRAAFEELKRLITTNFPELDEKREETLRVRAVLGIGRHATPEARTLLFGLLNDSNWRLAALRALAFFTDAEIVTELREFQRINPALESEVEATIVMIERRLYVQEIGALFDEAEELLRKRDEKE